MPALVYFENGIPSIYEDDLADEEEVLRWITKQRNEDTIETVNRLMLQKLINAEDYVAVYFYPNDCEEECDDILKEIEHIDDDAHQFGIHFVRTSDTGFARRFGFKQFPCIVLYRKRQPTPYKGDLLDEDALLQWLTDLDSMETSDQIEEINKAMFKKIVKEKEDVAVYFYADNCRQCDRVIQDLESVDDEAHSADIDFVKINDAPLARQYGIHAFPALVYFKNREPIIYAGKINKLTHTCECSC